MNFIQTRGYDETKPKTVTFSEAILSPIASFGGLYVPETLPELGEAFLKKHLHSSYKVLAADMLSRFEIDIEQSVIDEALALYDAFDDASNPVPVVKVKENLFVSELYHGPTRAFKDMALQPFGVVLSSIAQKRNANYLILAATSGDTGPAALETFKNRANVQVACLYPNGGTSDVQRLQMVTEDAQNLKVIGIHGVFDDAQNALKRLLASAEFNAALKEKNISLCSKLSQLRTHYFSNHLPHSQLPRTRTPKCCKDGRKSLSQCSKWKFRKRFRRILRLENGTSSRENHHFIK